MNESQWLLLAIVLSTVIGGTALAIWFWLADRVARRSSVVDVSKLRHGWRPGGTYVQFGACWPLGPPRYEITRGDRWSPPHTILFGGHTKESRRNEFRIRARDYAARRFLWQLAGVRHLSAEGLPEAFSLLPFRPQLRQLIADAPIGGLAWTGGRRNRQ